MRLAGSARPDAISAARTRSRASDTALSGSPTMVNTTEARRDLDLDVDRARLDPFEGDGRDACNHRANPAIVCKIARTSPDCHARFSQPERTSLDSTCAPYNSTPRLIASAAAGPLPLLCRGLVDRCTPIDHVPGMASIGRSSRAQLRGTVHEIAQAASSQIGQGRLDGETSCILDAFGARPGGMGRDDESTRKSARREVAKGHRSRVRRALAVRSAARRAPRRQSRRSAAHSRRAGTSTMAPRAVLTRMASRRMLARAEAVDHAARLLGQRAMQAHDVALLQQCLQTFDAARRRGRSRRRAADRDHRRRRACRRPWPQGRSRADPPEPDDAEGAAAQAPHERRAR